MSDECIHGFELGLCDVCFPKAPPPAPVRKTTAREPVARATTPRVQTSGDRRVYAVVSLDDLEVAVDSGQLDGEPRWTSDAAAWRRDDVVLASSIAALGTGTVFVQGDAITDGAVPLTAVQVVGVANEPVRERVRSMMLGLERPPRIVVHPPWFAPNA